MSSVQRSSPYEAGVVMTHNSSFSHRETDCTHEVDNPRRAASVARHDRSN
jgi:hypothetical protein